MPPPISNSPGWVEAIKLALKRGVREELHTCLPGRIESYDKTTQLADVRIVKKERRVNDLGVVTYIEYPIIPGVRVEFSQTSSFFMSFPLAAGDFVWLHFAESSVDRWFAKGGVGSEEPIERFHDFSDCWAVPARDPASPIAETENDSIVVGGKGSAPRAYFTNSIIGLGSKAPSEFVALATKVLTELDKIKTAFNTHTHTIPTLAVSTTGTAAAQTGTATGGPTGGPSATYTSASVAATKVKAL